MEKEEGFGRLGFLLLVAKTRIRGGLAPLLLLLLDAVDVGGGGDGEVGADGGEETAGFAEKSE